MHRPCLLSLAIIAGACSSSNKAARQPPAVYETNAHLVNDAVSAVMRCDQINVFDTFLQTHDIDDSAEAIDASQIPEDTKALSLSGSKVLDLTPVFGREFTFMDLSYSYFSAWDQLARFPELETLAVGGNQMNMNDLLAMKQALPNLKQLYVTNTLIEASDLDFTVFPVLEGLSLHMVKLGDPASFAAKLAGVRSLKTLQLDKVNPFIGNLPVNLESFSTLTQLENLIVNFGHVTGWESLGRMNFLKSLQARSREKEFQPQHIAELTELVTLDLSKTEWSSYDFSRLKKLKHLCLASNNLSDLATVSKLDQLETLDLRYNHIDSLSPLKDLGKLQNLVLTQDYEKDVEAGFNPILQPEKRSASNCPNDAQAKVVKDFCTPRAL